MLVLDQAEFAAVWEIIKILLVAGFQEGKCLTERECKEPIHLRVQGRVVKYEGRLVRLQLQCLTFPSSLEQSIARSGDNPGATGGHYRGVTSSAGGGLTQKSQNTNI